VALVNCDDFFGQSVTVEDSFLYYPQEHLWIKAAGDVYYFGVSHAGVILVNGFRYMEYAVDPGDVIDADDSVLFVETFKAMINLTSPVEGTVEAINEKLKGEGIKLLDEHYYKEFMFSLRCEGLDPKTVFISAQEYLEALLRGDADHCGAGAKVMRRNR